MDEGSLDETGEMMQLCWCSYADTVCANDEENFSMSIEEDDDL